MTSTDNNIANFAQGLLVYRRLDPDKLKQAQAWYKNFAGNHAVTMSDQDLIDIYETLN
jgi:hypothetical protein